MDQASFAAQLKRDGFSEIETKSQPPDVTVPAHAHDFEVRALVLEGEVTLTVGSESRTYRSGEVFTMAAGCEHAERYGPKGYRYLVGRKHRQP